MWSSLILVATLTLPGQAGQLNLANARSTYGPLGAPRKDNKLLPGDHVTIAFEVEGITVAADGKVQYSMATEVLNGDKVLFRHEPRDLEAVNALGGSSVPASTQLDVGLDSPPGEYTVRVTVTDRANKRTAVLNQKYTVLDKAFGLVRVTTTSDPDGRYPAAIFESGGSLWLNAGVVGFGRTAQGQAQVTVELRILDEKNQPTLAKPFVGELGKDVPANQKGLPVQFHVGLNRPGKFTIELKATDKVSGKTATLNLPLTVVAQR